jgi:hypothetical protein
MKDSLGWGGKPVPDATMKEWWKDYLAMLGRAVDKFFHMPFMVFPRP